MKVFTDLHIHSALSPCADNGMTPNNIVNMAVLKGLDIIAVTDHNSAENVGSVMKCAKDKELTVIPGMELETKEEVHLVCLFPNLEAALKIQDMVYASLPALKNREEIFGHQLIMDEQDEIKGCIERLLLTAADLTIEDVYYCVKSLGGVVIPAHVDRDSYSVISNLGMVPPQLEVKYLEVSRTCDAESLKKIHPDTERYGFIKSSDAHALGDILEREFFLELKEISVKSLMDKLRHG